MGTRTDLCNAIKQDPKLDTVLGFLVYEPAGVDGQLKVEVDVLGSDLPLDSLLGNVAETVSNVFTDHKVASGVVGRTHKSGEDFRKQFKPRKGYMYVVRNGQAAAVDALMEGFDPKPVSGKKMKPDKSRQEVRRIGDEALNLNP
jgi:hypothetical protein